MTFQLVRFKVKLKHKCSNIQVKGKEIPLKPGMAVTAEINTGERGVRANRL